MKLKSPAFVVLALLTVLATLAVPQSANAQQVWKAIVGSQSKDMGKQAIAFLPNELWIHAGDSIAWTSDSGDIHTVSFLIAGQPLTSFMVGCPGFSPSGTIFNGSMCVSAPPLVQGQTFTVRFTGVGNFSLVCLVHPHMTGVVHVLPTSAALPHDQAFYDAEGAAQRSKLLTDPQGMMVHSGHDMDDMMSTRVLHGYKGVAAGVGEMTATAAGFQSLSVVRFLNGNVAVHVGDTVEWTNLDPAMPHTITLGLEPNNPGPPSGNVSVDADGALHVTITSPAESVNSGLLAAAPENQVGVPQSAPGVTVFRATFTRAGTYPYKCALHDNLGMVGTVTVLP